MARILEREGRRVETPLLLVEAPAGDVSETPRQPSERESRPAKQPSTAPHGLQTRKTWALNELFRLSGRYKPGKYAGRVVVIQPEKSLSDEVLVRTVWKKAAENVRFRNTAGGHITCIGRFAPELAEILREEINAAF